MKNFISRHTAASLSAAGAFLAVLVISACNPPVNPPPTPVKSFSTSITGTVKDRVGNLIDGVEVRVGDLAVKSAKDGSFSLKGVTHSGSFTLSAKKSGYKDYTKSIGAPQGNTKLEIQLAYAYKTTVTGTVSGTGDKSGITIKSDTGGATATTNEKGEYTIVVEHAGKFTLTADGNGQIQKEAVKVNAPETTPENPESAKPGVVIALSPAVETVFALELKDPLNNSIPGYTASDFKVSTDAVVEFDSEPTNGTYPLKITTTGRGTFTVTVKAKGLFAEKSSNPINAAAPAGNTYPITVPYRYTTTVSGRVIGGPSSTGIDDAVITVTPGGTAPNQFLAVITSPAAPVKTNSTGNYTITVNHQGDFSIRAVKSGYGTRFKPIRGINKTGETKTGQDIRPPLRVTGLSYSGTTTGTPGTSSVTLTAGTALTSSTSPTPILTPTSVAIGGVRYTIRPSTFRADTGLTLDPSTGIITGTPNTVLTTAKSYTIIAAGVPRAGYTGSASHTISFKVDPAAIPAGVSYTAASVLRGSRVSPVSVNSGTVVTATYAFNTTGSNPTHPSWLRINSSTGEITAAAGAGGVVPASTLLGSTTYKIDVTGTGIYQGSTRQVDFELTVNQPLPTSISYTAASVLRGSSVSSVSVNNPTGATATYAFAASPARPSWLRINSSTGEITAAAGAVVPAGTTTGTTTYKIDVTGTGTYQGSTRQVDFELTVNQPLPTNMSYTAASVLRGNSISPVSVNNPTGATATYAFNTTTPNPTPPSWLRIDSSTGEITAAAGAGGVVPASTLLGSTTYKIDVTGTGTYQGSRRQVDFELTVNQPLPTSMSYTAASVLRGSSVSPVSVNNPTGATATYAFAASPARPSWLRINSSTGEITAAAGAVGVVPASTPLGSTTYKIDVTGTGTYQGSRRQVDFELTVNQPLPTSMSYTAASVLRGSSVSPVSVNNPTGATATYAFAASPARPSWLRINSSTGEITAAAGAVGVVPASTPLGSTTYKIDVTGTGTYQGSRRQVDFELTVNQPLPTSMSYTAASVLRGSSVSPVSVNNPTGATATYAFAASPARPSWLRINSSTGEITAAAGAVGVVPASTPLGSTTYKIDVTGTGTYQGSRRQVDFELTVNQPLPTSMSYTAASVLRGSSVSPVSVNNPTGATATYAFAASPARPSWLRINSSTGEITAAAGAVGVVPASTPLGSTTYKIDVTGTGTYQGSRRQVDFELTVNQPLPTSMSYTAASVLRGNSISPVSVNNPTGATATYAFAASPARPSWLRINSSTGEITAATGAVVPASTPLGSTTYKIDVTGTGTYQGSRRQVDFELTVNQPLPISMSYTAASVLRGSRVSAVSVNNAAGVTAAYAFNTTGSNPTPPSWLRINASTGEITAGAGAGGVVPASTPLGSTTYKIDVTGTGTYQGSRRQVDFELTVTQNLPASMSYSAASVARGSRVSAVGVNNAAGVTATYAFASSPAAPSWLRIDRSTGRISANAAVPSTTAGSVTTYRVNVTGTGNYQGSTRALDFVLTVTQPLPSDMGYIKANGSTSATARIVNQSLRRPNSGITTTTLRTTNSSLFTLGAAEADFAFVPIPSGRGCPAVTIDNTTDGYNSVTFETRGRIAFTIGGPGSRPGNFTYRVTVTGKGTYSGTRTVTFKADITGGGTSLGNVDCF